MEGGRQAGREGGRGQILYLVFDQQSRQAEVPDLGCKVV
jgi:hypothetical protein